MLTSLVASTLFVSSAFADVKFSSPAAGAVISGSEIDVEFTDGGEDPPITDFTSYILQLCAGGNADGEYVSHQDLALYEPANVIVPFRLQSSRSPPRVTSLR